MPQTKPESLELIDFFVWFRKLPHQLSAISELESKIREIAPSLLDPESDWFATWRASGRQRDLTAALDLIKSMEGLSLTAYTCPAGHPTIGFGTRRYEDGRPVRLKHSITHSRAEELLQHEVQIMYEKLATRIPFWDEMNSEMQCALVSFAYNLGVNFYGAEGFRTITAKLRDKLWNSVPAAMFLYHNPGTHFAEGLQRRRIAEGELWMSGLRNADH